MPERLAVSRIAWLDVMALPLSSSCAGGRVQMLLPARSYAECEIAGNGADIKTALHVVCLSSCQCDPALDRHRERNVQLVNVLAWAA